MKASVGAAVRHATYGEGTVVGSRYSGTQVRVKLRNGTEVWVPALSVEETNGNSKAAANNGQHGLAAKVFVTPAWTSPKPGGFDVRARRMIEAFRLGIVPAADVASFTVGREAEHARIMALLQEGGGTGLAIISEEYGGGKTHFLDYLHAVLPSQGYAVARVAFNGADVLPFMPRSVYHELVTSLRYPRKDGTVGTFRDLLREHAALGTELQHPLLGVVLALLRMDLGEDAEEALFEWIEGEPAPRAFLRHAFAQYLPLLYADGTAVDNYCNTFSVISKLTRDLGVQGLALLFDEAEYIWRLDVTVNRQHQAKNLLGGILHLASQGKSTFNDGYQEWVLTHSGRRPMEFLDQEGTGVFAVLAFAQQTQHLTTDPRRTLSLAKFTGARGRAVVDAIQALYRSSYPTASRSLGEPRIRAILEGSNGQPRFLMKATAEALDLLRLDPQDALGGPSRAKQAA